MARALIIAAAALGVSLSASAVHAASKWNGPGANGIWENGNWQNGIWENGVWQNGSLRQGARLNGLHNSADAKQPAVRAVILLSGEIVDLR